MPQCSGCAALQRSNPNEPLDAWVVVAAIVSFLDVLFGVGQFQRQSLTPQLQISAKPPLLLVALHPDSQNSIATRRSSPLFGFEGQKGLCLTSIRLFV